ncbi:MAG: hypothetical protein IKX23_07445 [Treponema sp.]|nr:hypothetical protein [Treponema sp.]
MKKRLFIISMMIFLASSSVAAFESGFTFSGGLQGSFICKFYTNECISYKMFFDENTKIGLSIDVSSTQNLIPTSSSEQIVYFDTGLAFYCYDVYLGGGVFFLKNQSPSFYMKTGYDFGNWDWGPGKGFVYLGMIVSPTFVVVDSDGSAEGAVGSVFGTTFGSLLNMIKIECGVRYYLPF